MPALKIYGRSWYTTSDMLPLPATIFTLIYVVYICVFAPAIAHLDVWQSCKGAGVHYKVTTAGLMAVFSLSALLQAGMIVFGFQGTCFETQRRRPVLSLLYVQTFVWIAQAVIMVYGTVILYLNSVKPTCWTEHRRAREGLTHAMIWSTWAQIIFLLLIVWLTYNSYQGKNIKSWEGRLKAMSTWLCCGQHVNTPMAKRAAPLPSIAQWINSLFANVDLSPTDLIEAVILAAAAQSMRRRMRIKKALQPALARASGAGQGDSDSGSDSDDDLSSILSMDTVESSDSDGSDEEQGQGVGVDGRQRNAGDGAGARERKAMEGQAGKGGGGPVAMPLGCREDWSGMATKMYNQVSGAIPANEAEQIQAMPSPTSSLGKTRDPPGAQNATSNDRVRPNVKQSGACMGPGRDGPGVASGSGDASGRSRQSVRGKPFEGQGAQEVVECQESSITSAFADSSRHSVAGSEAPKEVDEPESSGSARARGSTSDRSRSFDRGSSEGHVSLSEVDNDTLEDFTREVRRSGAAPTPKERFGIARKKRGRRRVRPPRSLQEPTRGSPANTLSRAGTGETGTTAGRGNGGRSGSGGDPSLPSHMTGKLQVGLNEPGGGIPPMAEAGSLSRAFTFDSSVPPGGSIGRTSLEVSPGDLGAEVIADEGLATEQVVPLERKSNRIAPIITPSEEVSEVVGKKHNLPIAKALEAVVGKQKEVSYDTLEECTNWSRFASAAYAVMPAEERKGRFSMKIREPVTEERVRDAIVEIAGIEAEDLLYFSHSNKALSHLPYMIALDRDTKTVVVAIRGTMSLADLVTDAVVHPESLAAWMPAATRKEKQKAREGRKRAYAHSGIKSAANAVLLDLENNGILHTLLQPDQVRKKSAEYRNLGRGVGGIADRHNSNSSQGSVASDEKNTGGVYPSVSFQAEMASSTGPGAGKRDEEGHEMASAAADAQGDKQQQGEATGAALQKNLDTKGWSLVLTGHSLGAGAAALISLKIHDRYPDLKCWAFSPPGGLVSSSLVGYMEGWCTSVVVGKDAVPRMTVNNLSRLMDEMVCSLARVRHHKLRVLCGRWWRESNRPPPKHLFYSYRDIPAEARLTLERYQKSTARKGRAKNMFPPGRVIFLRPIKLLLDPKDRSKKDQKERRVKQQWDAIWTTPHELIGEGILVSKKMLAHHSITGALTEALGYCSRHHADNPKSEGEKLQDKRSEKHMANELQDIRIDGDDAGPMDLLSQGSA